MAKQTLVHFQAFCHDCEKRCESRNAQAWAHNHANYHGHNVSLELGWAVRTTTDTETAR
jgi:hypothetical protein